ncbi:hypothetical protein GLOIN_2v1757723, partial [Rhizophagus irregularis DAOM 181602=DAOM 197198]
MGYTFDQIQELINQKIQQLNQITNNLVNWLTENQDKPKYIWFFGLFYYYDIEIEENNRIKEFELFLKAADDNYSIAQVYLAKCYNDGYGTEQNKDSAFKWYQKAAENERVEQNKRKAFKLFQKLAEQGYEDAQYELGKFYYSGIEIEVNKTRAFELYKIAAEKGQTNAQNELGTSYEHGDGTEQDLEKAIYWYNKAAENG